MACSSSIIGVSSIYHRNPSLEQLSRKIAAPAGPLHLPRSADKTRFTSVKAASRLKHNSVGVGRGSAFVASATSKENQRAVSVPAFGRNISMSAHKARRVIDQIRGRSYEEALMILELMPYRACYPIFKLVYSAAANASFNMGSNEANLVISKAEVNEGTTMKRSRPRAKGRIYRIQKPTCHITIVMKDISLDEYIDTDSITWSQRPKCIKKHTTMSYYDMYSNGGRDIIARAKTGTGKTLAFGIPIIKRLTEDDEERISPRHAQQLPRVLVLAPTRELARQVETEIKESAPYLSTVCVYGGVSSNSQQNALSRGVDVVVGTPGRLIDLIGSNSLKLGEVQLLVLDEADQMLAVGFEEDVEHILEKLPSERQSMLFSATMPGWVKKLSRKYLNNPLTIDLDPTTNLGAKG